jgi:putative inorganic carbon (HCO3(-)) transporter
VASATSTHGRAAVARSPVSPRAATIALVVVVIAAAVAGAARGGGAEKTVWLVPLVAVGAAGMAWLAIARFTVFVAAILVIRSSLDAFKLTEDGTGATDPAALLSLAFLAAGTIWYLAQPADSRPTASPLVAPLALLTIVGAFSTIAGVNPGPGMVDTVKLLTVVLILLVLNELLRDDQGARVILFAVFLSAVIPIAVGAVQYLTGSGFHYSGGFARVRGTFNHPNPFAIYLTLMLIMGGAIFRFVRERFRLPLGLLLAACGVMLVLTYTRSAWIATVAGLLVVGGLQGKKTIMAVGLLAVVVALFVPSVAARFSDLDQTSTATGEAGNSLVWRFDYWRQAIDLNRNPVLGIGLSSVRIEGSEEKAPHNDFIRVYVETGFLGLAAYLWFLARGAAVAIRGLRETEHGPFHGLVVGFTGVFVAFCILSIVSNVITQLVIFWYVAGLAALAVAAPRIAPRMITVRA